MRYARRIGIACVSFALTLVVWGIAVEPRLLDHEAEAAPIAGLPPAWDGQRIGVIADLQIGLWLDNQGTVREAVARLVAERPAAVLIAGDFVYDASPDPSPELTTVIDILRPLTAANIPTYAVLGNHDYRIDRTDEARQKDPTLADRIRSSLGSIRITVLHNEAVALPAPAGEPPLYLVGIGPHLPGEDRPLAAVESVPDGAPRLVFMHNPESFVALPAGTAPVAVAGHTHGGQVRLVPFLPEWSLAALVQPERLHADDWIDGYGAPGNRLYVNRGIGMSVIPMRLFCPPELTLFTLRSRKSP
jgi:uncharacterized protein